MFKERTIQRLLIMGQDKGIESQSTVARSKSTKKQLADIQRQRELWQKECAAEKQRLSAMEREKEETIELYRGQLQDAMFKISALTHSEHELQRQLSQLMDIAKSELPEGLINGIESGHVQPKKKRAHR